MKNKIIAAAAKLILDVTHARTETEVANALTKFLAVVRQLGEIS